MVTIRLTAKEANLVWKNADGWMDAGSCEGGLEPDERAALDKLCWQILEQTSLKEKNSVKRAAKAPKLTGSQLREHHPWCSVHKGKPCDYDCARDYRPAKPDSPAA